MYAVVRSLCACAAVGVVRSMVWGASTTPGGKPVTAEPGQTPRLASRTVKPSLVTVLPANAPYRAASPRLTAVTGVAACATMGAV